MSIDNRNDDLRKRLAHIDLSLAAKSENHRSSSLCKRHPLLEILIHYLSIVLRHSHIVN